MAQATVNPSAGGSSTRAALGANARAAARRLGLPAFLRWWQTELAPLVPRAPRIALQRRRLRPVLAVAPDAAVLWEPALGNGALAWSEVARIPLAGDAAAARAVDYVRQQRAPYFLELHTYRFRAHSMFDAELYRAKAEVEAWKERGPIHTFTQRLKAANMLTEAQFLALDQAAMQEVDAAVAFAEAGSSEPVEDLTKDVLTPRPPAAVLTSGGPR